MKKSALLIVAVAALLAACGKAPEAPSNASPVAVTPVPAPAGQGAPTAPRAAQGPAAAAPAPGAAQPTTAPNPDALKDPVFNMPPQPVLDVARTKADFEKIVADSLK